MIDKEDLITFEVEIAELFKQGKIRSPIHLSGGNEEQLIEIFKDVRESDWVFSTHRSHLHALLKGIPPQWLKQEILDGHSITLNNKDYHFFSSAIVGGILPVGVGLAMTGQRVWCFIGDMAAETGIFHECVKYAHGHGLDITFVIEDNGLSVQSPTKEVWGTQTGTRKIIRYEYLLLYPHQGINKWVTFF